MQRYFYRRGKRVAVEEIDGVLAVRMDDRARDGAVASELGQILEAETSAVLDGAPGEEVSALADAGWRILRPSERLAAATRGEAAAPADVEEVGKVFQMPDGHLLVGARSIIVQLPSNLTEDEARAELEEQGLRIVRPLRFADNQFQVAVPSGQDLLGTANALQESGRILHAEPEFVEVIGERLTPNDPSYAGQWHLSNSGASGGTIGADINAEAAWDFTRGTGIRLAVIDNGFDVAHSDLAPAIVAESGFFDSSGDFRQTLTGFPDGDHGTFCAGMAAARQNNALDGCGSAPECELMLVGSQGDQVGTQATLARAVAFAANPHLEATEASPAAGADVIVSSLGPNGPNWSLTAVLENAILFASRRGRKGRGTPIFWASSNGNNVDIGLDEVVSHPQVIAVGRSRRDDMEDNSARGPALDFLAPGVDVVSTTSGGGTRPWTGTSFAAPLAAGVGALVLSANPDLTGQGVRQVLRGSCDKIGGAAYDAAGHNPDYGHGRINAYRAVVHAMQTIATGGTPASDQDGDGRAEIPVVSPWGIGTLKYGHGSLDAPSMAPNGSRFDGWLLNTTDNCFPASGDFDGDGRSEMLVTSPWGLGILRQSGSGYAGLMLSPNGTRFGGWLLNTADNRFGLVGDFDGDGRQEIVVTSPWGIGLLEYDGATLTPTMMAPNGTRCGGWLLNTADNRFGPVGDFDGDGRDEIMVTSPWGIGILKLPGGSLTSVMLAPNGNRFGGWLFSSNDNWLGPVGDFDGDGRDEVMIGSAWGLGMLKLSGLSLDAPFMAPNGTRFGGWLLNSHDNRFLAAADFDGDGRSELLVTSPWGIGVLKLAGTSLGSAMLAPNGTRFGGWLLNTADNRFRRFSDMTGGGRAYLLVESPWGIGLLALNGSTFDAPMMAPNGTRLGGWLLNTADNRF